MDNEVPGGQRFHTTEQYMHYLKALLYEDRGAAEAIRGCYQPWRAKDEGRRVRGFDEENPLRNLYALRGGGEKNGIVVRRTSEL